MKTCLRSCILFLLIMYPAISSAKQAIALDCPAIEMVKSNPFKVAIVDRYMGWIAVAPPSNYGTDNEWLTAVIVGGKPGKISAREVIERANYQLTLIAVKGEPDGKSCFYLDNQQHPQVMIYATRVQTEAVK